MRVVRRPDAARARPLSLYLLRSPRFVLRRPLLREIALALGLHSVEDVRGGYQSRGVYAARRDDQLIILKLVDARLVDRSALETRLDMLLQLGATTETVCRPVALAGRLLNEYPVGRRTTVFAVAYEFADGDPPVTGDPQQARLMGEVLAALHGSMARLPRFDLPALAAFPARSTLTEVARDIGVPLTSLRDPAHSPAQLLHGDFSGENMRLANGAARVFDFDDCGYGSVEHDVAHTLYMVLFDALTGGEPAGYTTFRKHFVDGYRNRSGVDLSESTLDALVTYRVVVLASWLARPDTAPIGIRTSPDDWRARLDQFIAHYVERAF